MLETILSFVLAIMPGVAWQKLLLLGAGTTAGGGGGDTPFVSSFTAGTTRNDFAGCVGFQFTVGGSSITVTSLGRWKLTGNSTTHAVKITNGSSVLVSANVDMSGGSVGTWVYTTISDTVLSASTSYYLLSVESNGGDTWPDQPNSPNSTTGVATMNASAYSLDSTNCTNMGSFQGSSFGMPNFKYH